MSKYQPEPIDTSGVQLPSSLALLTEALARNTHENWAKLRMNEGWRWGPQRDDDAREHPGLVPYEALSESEKDYDRQTSLETLKTILALGYTIHDPDRAD